MFVMLIQNPINGFYANRIRVIMIHFGYNRNNHRENSENGKKTIDK